MRILHFFNPGDIEIGTGGPGYRWTKGYSLIDSQCGNITYPWVTRRGAYLKARLVGGRAIFHSTKEAAIEAARHFTRDEIRSKAEDHVAYGWSKSPGTHNRFKVWTPEDTAIYNEEYNKAIQRLDRWNN